MIILLILALFVAVSFGLTAISAAPWVPLRKKDINALLKDLNLSHGKVFVELGSGDGRLLKAAGNTGAMVIGYELNPFLWLVSYFRLLGTPTAKVYLRNFWKRPLDKADCVMAFLVPRTMPRLAHKLGKEMQPGSRFISYVFALPGKDPAVRHRSWYIYDF